MDLPKQQFYVLRDRKPVPVSDVLEWAKSREHFEENCRIGYTIVRPDGTTVERSPSKPEESECAVSTVFLGIDHGWGRGKPVLFETLVFNGPPGLEDEMDRYCTFGEAVSGHREMVERVKATMIAGSNVDD
jgi:hypothetical protein